MPALSRHRCESLATIACHDCGLFRVCFARRLGVGEDDGEPLASQRQRPLPRGRAVTLDGDALAVLRSGAVKRTRYTPAGNELISGFYFAGEVIGLNAAAEAGAGESLVVLEQAHVCEIPWSRIEALMDDSPTASREVSAVLRGAMTRTREGLLRACRGTARQRVAGFVLDMAERHQHGSPAGFRLAMDRREIAAYLDLTIETVSRVLSELRRAGNIGLQGRWLRIVDTNALARHAGDAGPIRAPG